MAIKFSEIFSCLSAASGNWNTRRLRDGLHLHPRYLSTLRMETKSVSETLVYLNCLTRHSATKDFPVSTLILTSHIFIYLARRLFLYKFSELTLTFIAHLPNFSLSLYYAFEYFNLCSSRKRKRTQRILDPTVASFPWVYLFLLLSWIMFWFFCALSIYISEICWTIEGSTCCEIVL